MYHHKLLFQWNISFFDILSLNVVVNDLRYVKNRLYWRMHDNSTIDHTVRQYSTATSYRPRGNNKTKFRVKLITIQLWTQG